MMSAKVAAPALLKINAFWNKVYCVIYSVYEVTNKILSHESNYSMDVVMWPKFGNCHICIREVIITSILWAFFEGWSWFKFNNLGLALRTNLKFYTSLNRVNSIEVDSTWLQLRKSFPLSTLTLIRTLLHSTPSSVYHTSNGIIQGLLLVPYCKQSSSKPLCIYASMYRKNNIKVSESFKRTTTHFSPFLIAQLVFMVTHLVLHPNC